jgi:hypothetical protein
MFQADYKDPEGLGGAGSGMIVCQYPTVLSSLIWPIYAANRQPYGLHIAQIRTPHGDPKLLDSSVPLFDMYTKITKEDDDKMTTRWQRDAEGIRLFVGPFFLFLLSYTP